jgi:hypothetical protein
VLDVPARQIDRVADRLIPITLSGVRPHRAAVAQIHDANYAQGRCSMVDVLCSVAVYVCKECPPSGGPDDVLVKPDTTYYMVIVCEL